ncbi:zinc finger protein egl-43-like [Anopheles marshallii]|uniref:zinc finger protein egl-43-like n=1 Tax=Anopheles marshallii TaxID=1521116 RepID=UPI00237AC491|nr:zinc finger protein egl-43-like [Anopheles marshallii]
MSGGLENMHLENVCRLCLTDASEAGDMFPIFPVRGGNPYSPTSVVNRILQCTSLRLEQTEGVPATICELCSVRLEDWHAFREQCVGSDEYLRVTLRHAFYPDEGQTSHSASSNPAIPVLPPNGNHLSKSSPIYTDSMSTKPSPVGRNVSMTPPPPVSSRLTLAKRRQSTFELPVSDGRGNTTDQKILVEVLGVCNDTGKRPSVPTFDGMNGQQDKPNGFSTLDNTMLEQASWSREYCARINNLMVKVNGPRPFKCKVCRRMFNNRTNMRRHIKVLHSDEVFEGESPPPECYGYTDQVDQSQQDMSRPPVKKKRKSTDPPIVGPYKCEVCPRSFKMPAHLAVHRKTHRQIEFDQSELSRAIEQQKQQMQQQQRERSSSAVSSEVDRTRKATTIEPCDVIQLSDDDEEEEAVGKTLQRTAFGAGDDLDDGFDEEEGSLKETSLLDADLRPDPSSLAIVQIGAEDNDGPEQSVTERHDEEEDEDIMVVQDVESKAPASKPKPGPSSTRAPPGPLSSKLKYSNQTASGTDGAKLHQKPLIAARPIEDLQRKQSSSHSTAVGPASKQKLATVGTPPTTEHQPSSSSTTTVHRCHLCRHTFPREDMLRDHQKSHQNDTPCAYRCGWCKKGFRYRQNYTLHLEKQTCRLINADPVRALQQQQQSQQQAGKCT